MNVVTLYIFNNATTGTQKKGDRAKVWLQEIYRHTTSTHKKQAHTFVPQQYKFTSNSCGYKTKLANQHGAQTKKRLQIYYVLCAPDWITCECGNIHNPSLKATDFFTHEPAQAAGTASAHTETSSLADQDANSASTQLTAYPLHHKDHSTFPQKKKKIIRRTRIGI